MSTDDRDDMLWSLHEEWVQYLVVPNAVNALLISLRVVRIMDRITQTDVDPGAFVGQLQSNDRDSTK